MRRVGWASAAGRVCGVLVVAGCAAAAPKDVTPDTSDPDLVDTDTVDTRVDSDSDGSSDSDTVDSDPVAVDSDDSDDSDAPVDTDRADADGDTVPDGADRCPGLDDRIDLNADGTPDCAQTLVTNGQLTTGMTGFSDQRVSANRSTATWSSDDATAWAASGSVWVVNETVATLANAAGLYGPCIAARPGDTFDVWFHYTVPTGGGTGPQLIVSFDTYHDAGCTQAAASTTPPPTALSVGAGWHAMHMGAPITMWPDWQGFRLRVELYKPGVTTPLGFGLDDVLVLGP